MIPKGDVCLWVLWENLLTIIRNVSTPAFAAFRRAMNARSFACRSRMWHKERIISACCWNVQVSARKQPAWWPWMQSMQKRCASCAPRFAGNAQRVALNLRTSIVSSAPMNAANVPRNARSCEWWIADQIKRNRHVTVPFYLLNDHSSGGESAFSWLTNLWNFLQRIDEKWK